MILAVQHFDRVAVAQLPVDVDIANALEVGEQLSRAIGPEAPGLILDLARTRYLDSAGLTMLFTLGEGLRDRRQKLLLAIPADSTLMHLVRIASLESAARIYPTVQAALDACQADRPLGRR